MMPLNKGRRGPLDAARSGKRGDGLLGVCDHYIKPAYEQEIGPLWKAYVGRRVACHFHFKINDMGKHRSHNFCADFQAFPSPGESHVDDVEADWNGRGTSADKDWVEGFVFVPVGEFFKNREAVPFRVVRSIVELREIGSYLGPTRPEAMNPS